MGLVWSNELFRGASNDLYPEEVHKVIVIEGCEYIFISRRPFDSQMALAHKGNCKNHE